MATDNVTYKIKLKYTFWFYYILYGAKLVRFVRSKRLHDHFINVIKTKELIKLTNEI